MIVGTVEHYKTEAQALRASEGIRMRVNQAGPQLQPTSFGALVDRFILEEIPTKKPIGIDTKNNEEGGLAYSTATSYLSMLNTHIKPKWQDYLVPDVKPALVQEWLNGKQAAPKYKGHIKALMRRLFEKGMLWEILPLQRNPMELVEIRGISKRQRRPRILTLEEFFALLKLLHEPYRTMVIVAQCTGLRVSEILALRWFRINFENLTMVVKQAVVSGRVKGLKTDYSDDELPLDPSFATILLRWRTQCLFSEGDWVFPSPITGRCYHASPIQQDYIRPAGVKAGLWDGIGWHTFRHTYRAWLDATGAPVGVQQKLMRHAQVSTTMNIYGNALMESKRKANSKVARMALRPVLLQKQ
jgi:integrase